MSKVHFNPPLVPVSVRPLQVFIQEDTAGNRYYSEFEPGCTVPVRTWVEHPELPVYWWRAGKEQESVG